MQKTSTTWSVGNPVTATRLNQFNADLDALFNSLSSEDIDTTYNGLGQLTQIVDNENSITVNLDWSSITSGILYVQKAGDPKKWTVTYGLDGFISSIIYS